MRRAVITGAGTINPLGTGLASTYQAMTEGRCAISELRIPDADRLRVKLGAQVQDYSPLAHFSPERMARLDRFSQFALIAAREAITQSGIVSRPFEPEKAGVIIGNAGGGMETQDASFKAVYAENKDRVHPLVVPMLMSNAPASQISIEYGFQGPSFGVSSACASANHAIILSAQMIRAGLADVMLSGGSEAMLTFGGIKAWESLRVLSSTGCRPFSADRDGMVMGEGSAVFVIEEYEHAKARGAHILAEISGIAMNSDASDLVRPDSDSAKRVMLAALHDASISPDDIGYINAHGTGTVTNDVSEARAIASVFAKAKTRPMVSSTKSQHGHLIGAASALELLSCLLALEKGIIAPTIGTSQPDPECDIDLVCGQARELAVKHTLSNAFAFGGLNASIVLSKL